MNEAPTPQRKPEGECALGTDCSPGPRLSCTCWSHRQSGLRTWRTQSPRSNLVVQADAKPLPRTQQHRWRWRSRKTIPPYRRLDQKELPELETELHGRTAISRDRPHSEQQLAIGSPSLLRSSENTLDDVHHISCADVDKLGIRIVNEGRVTVPSAEEIWLRFPQNQAT